MSLLVTERALRFRYSAGGGIEGRLKIAERRAACAADPRDREPVLHGLAEIIRFRALPIAAGYPSGNDRDVLRFDEKSAMAGAPGKPLDAADYKFL